MTVIFLLIPLSVVIATGFLLAFIWAVRSGQYEDTCTPAMRLLLQDGGPRPERPGPSACKTAVGPTVTSAERSCAAALDNPATLAAHPEARVPISLANSQL